MRRILPVLSIAIVALAALPASAFAAFTLVAPAAGSSTPANEVKTDWAGTCDAGFTCNLFEVVYSQKADLDAVGRLLVQPSQPTEVDQYETAYLGDPAPGTTLSPKLNPGTWNVQLQWRQSDADYNCTDQQTVPSSFTLAHSLVRPIARVTNRYQYLRQIDFNVEFTGNAPVYGVRGTVAVQKVRRNGTRYWAPIWNKFQTRYGQYGRSKSYFNWKAGRTRRGTRLRITGTITAPGMRPRVVTTFTTSV